MGLPRRACALDAVHPEGADIVVSHKIGSVLDPVDGGVIESMAAKLIYVTTGSSEDARRIGEALVRERLVACVNILPAIESIYWWQGAIQHDNEAVLIAKTRADLVESVVARVRALHSYSVPCVVALPIEAGNPAFLRWIEEETATGAAAASETA
jgi:periplasmic divalent cation tolerance protein